MKYKTWVFITAISGHILLKSETTSWRNSLSSCVVHLTTHCFYSLLFVRLSKILSVLWISLDLEIYIMAMIKTVKVIIMTIIIPGTGYWCNYKPNSRWWSQHWDSDLWPQNPWSNLHTFWAPSIQCYPDYYHLNSATLSMGINSKLIQKEKTSKN